LLEALLVAHKSKVLLQCLIVKILIAIISLHLFYQASASFSK